MPRYVNTVTKEIVDYPEEAAALFPALKLVPSERDKDETKIKLDDDKTVVKSQPKDDRNAK